MPTAKHWIFPLVLTLALILPSLSRAESAASTTPAASVAAGRLPKMVDVGADKCIPCKMMAPILEELKTEYAGKFEVEFVDAWKFREKAARYGVQMIPTQIFYDASGKELFRHSGFIGKEEILARWRELGYDFRD
ncbi:thioredoxin [Desulfuromonas soudanensis]|uniref:Thioredoxin n=1 Tax=Desulfuromonas soudanensis TaxID=1603606 RepID=A0A0M4DL13_9BACT|nr:thioredoxin family protein [Desulfuromonas soudanensis]ALC18045.1 thioredoxin [Desulfuromonas soudanensis]